MARLALKWSDRATTDLDEILTFYHQRNGNNHYSQRLKNKIDDVLEIVRDNPLFGTKATRRGFRYVIICPFRIYYRIADETIVVVRIWDNRRNPKSFRY